MSATTLRPDRRCLCRACCAADPARARLRAEEAAAYRFTEMRNARRHRRKPQTQRRNGK